MFGGVGSQFGWKKEVGRVCVPGREGGVEWKALVESKRRNREKCLEAYNIFNICSTQKLDDTNHLKKKEVYFYIFFAFKRKCLVALLHSLPLYLPLWVCKPIPISSGLLMSSTSTQRARIK